MLPQRGRSHHDRFRKTYSWGERFFNSFTQWGTPTLNEDRNVGQKKNQLLFSRLDLTPSTKDGETVVLLLVYYTWTLLWEMSAMVVVLNLELVIEEMVGKIPKQFFGENQEKSPKKWVISAMLWDLYITYLLQRGFHRGGICSNEFNLESEKKKGSKGGTFY